MLKQDILFQILTNIEINQTDKQCRPLKDLKKWVYGVIIYKLCIYRLLLFFFF